MFISPLEDNIRVETASDSWQESGEYEEVFYTYSQLKYGPSSTSNPILMIPQCSTISLIGDRSYFYIDTSPTLGFTNDTIGGLGEVHGRLYDYCGNIFTSGNFKLRDKLTPFMQFNEDSTFNVVAPANNSFSGDSTIIRILIT